MSEEYINNTEWQNTHDLAVITLSWKVGNIAQHSKEKLIWVIIIDIMEIQVKYLEFRINIPDSSFPPQLHKKAIVQLE